jgi:hypothetical protein
MARDNNRHRSVIALQHLAGRPIAPVGLLAGRLVLCFPYQSARIDPVAISLFLMGIGGVWIVVGLVVMDRL